MTERRCDETCHAIVHFGSDSSIRVYSVASLVPEKVQVKATGTMSGKATTTIHWGSGRSGDLAQQLQEFKFPNNVCDRCRSLRRGIFGVSPHLERIGVECFVGRAICDVIIPDSVCD